VNGRVVYEGDVVVVGDTDEPDAPLFGDTVRYELLCRRHYRSGELADDDDGR
jgi:thymidine kinase